MDTPSVINKGERFVTLRQPARDCAEVARHLRERGTRCVFKGGQNQFWDALLANECLRRAVADGATEGALFAHCTGSESHHVGSWFLGATPGAAVASMIYFMEAFTDLPVLKPEVLGGGSTNQARRGHAFDAIHQATTALGRGSVATLVGSELGMISGGPNKPARLTFPFRDGNRASRSGLVAARSLGLASSR